MADKKKIYHSELPAQEKAAFLIICSAQEISNKLSGLIRQFDISLTQLQILHVLDELADEKITVNAIRNLLVDDSPNVSRSINKLVEKGLVTKKRSQSDQRVVYVKITEEGLRTHHLCDKKIAGNTIHLPEKESNTLSELLMQL